MKAFRFIVLVGLALISGFGGNGARGTLGVSAVVVGDALPFLPAADQMGDSTSADANNGNLITTISVPGGPTSTYVGAVTTDSSGPGTATALPTTTATKPVKPASTRLIIPASDKRVQLRGRWSRPINSDGVAWNNFTNAAAVVQFKGSSSVQVLLDSRTTLEVIYYRIVKQGNGKMVPGGIGGWNSLNPLQSFGTKPQIRNLDPKKTYVLEILIRLGSYRAQFGAFVPKAVLKGFGLDLGATVLSCGTPRVPWIEFTGDSVTGHVYPTSPNYPLLGSYPYEACRSLGTMCSVVARASVRLIGGLQWGFFSSQPWNSTLNLQWNFKAQGFVPLAVVINVGTNDFKTDLDAFKKAYIALVKGIRKVYGKNTYIVAMTPFGERRGSPGRYYMQLAFPVSVFQEVVAQANDPRFQLLDTSDWITPELAGQYLYDGLHPNGPGAVYLGDKVAAALRSMGAVPRLRSAGSEPLCA